MPALVEELRSDPQIGLARSHGRHRHGAPARTRHNAALYRALIICLCLIPAPAAAEGFRADRLLLTWQRDPTSTMTIQWMEPGRLHPIDQHLLGIRRPMPFEYIPPAVGELRYWKRGSDHSEEMLAQMELTAIVRWPGMFIQRVELTGLEAGSEYRFRGGDSAEDYGFRTAPADLSEPFRLALGGDTRHEQKLMERTNAVAMRYKPDVIVWGGDLAYGDGRQENLYRWEEWFDANYKTLIDEDRRVVPIIIAIGNHEVRGSFYSNIPNYQPTNEVRLRLAPYFFQFFAFPGQPGYNVLDFGSYLSLIALDTNHTNPIRGEQTEWLERVLADRAHVPHVLPFYHIPAFPSHREYAGSHSRQIRQHWLPLFEKYGVELAFENHDHAYKRTHPIQYGKIDASGVTYIGDGAWGVGVRKVHDVEATWYLARAQTIRHAIILTLHGTQRHLLVVSETGEIIDELPSTGLIRAR
jgi:acid phosphatase type 7